MVPAFGTDLRVHHRVQKNSAAIVAPRPPKINAVLCVAAGQTTSIKNKTRGFVRGETHRSGDVAVALTVNVAILKNCCRLSEDEIDVALDVTVLIKLPPVFGVKRVLPTEKTTIFENGSVGLNQDRNGLRAGAERIFKSNILSVKIVPADVCRIGR